MKSGWKTSEFWLTLLANIIGALLTSGLIADDSDLAKALGAAMIVLATLGYTFNRAVVKSSVSESKTVGGGQVSVTTTGPTQ